jgi:hypothetical protein
MVSGPVVIEDGAVHVGAHVEDVVEGAVFDALEEYIERGEEVAAAAQEESSGVES